jgi:hypothetical protein
MYMLIQVLELVHDIRMDHVRRPKLSVVHNAQRFSCAKIFLSLPTSMLHGALKTRRSLWFFIQGVTVPCVLASVHSDDLDCIPLRTGGVVFCPIEAVAPPSGCATKSNRFKQTWHSVAYYYTSALRLVHRSSQDLGFALRLGARKVSSIPV